MSISDYPDHATFRETDVNTGLSICHTKRCTRTKKNWPTMPDQKNRHRFFRIFVGVFLLRLGDNPPIWVSHSLTLFSQF